MCELEEPGARMAAEGVDNIVMFFGSARAKPKAQYEAAVKEAEAKVAANPGNAGAQAGLERLRKQEFLVGMFDVVVQTTRLLTEWAMRRQAEGRPAYYVGTGGGPGMMQAANEGATKGGGKSAGLGISLPFEDGLNPYVTPSLGFELLTLMQTGKIKRPLPVILIGKKFWHDCITWDAFVEYGMISAQDASQLKFADTAEEAFQFLVDGIEKMENEGSKDGKK